MNEMEFVGSCDIFAQIKYPCSLCSWLYLAIFNPFISNLPPFNFYDYVLVVVNHFTKIGHFTFCTKTITSERITKLFVDHVFLLSWPL